MSSALGKVATIAGVVAATFALPGVGTALGLSAATTTTVASVATPPSNPHEIGAQRVRRMTLQNGSVSGANAYLWTDTAIWNGSTGEKLGYDSKAFTITTWPAAGVLSCHGGNPHEIAFAIGNAYPTDEAELLKATVDALRAYCLKGGEGRVLLATNKSGPRLFMVASDGAGLAEPFDPVELLSFTSSGNKSAAYQLAIANGFTPERMARVIDAQIAEPGEGMGRMAAFGAGVWIGGNVVELAVTPEGIKDRVLRNVDSEAA